MSSKRTALAAAVMAAALTAACSTAPRGPVDRSLDTVHATNRTTGETAEGIVSGPGDAIVSVLTFPFKLVGRGFAALFGP